MPPLPTPVMEHDLTLIEHYSIILDRWLMANKREFIGDIVKVLFFKFLAVLLVLTGLLFFRKAQWSFVCLGGLALVMDAIFRPGSLLGVHRHAVREIELFRRKLAEVDPASGPKQIVKDTGLIWGEIQVLAVLLKETESLDDGFLPVSESWKGLGGLSLTVQERRKLRKPT